VGLSVLGVLVVARVGNLVGDSVGGVGGSVSPFMQWQMAGSLACAAKSRLPQLRLLLVALVLLRLCVCANGALVGALVGILVGVLVGDSVEQRLMSSSNERPASRSMSHLTFGQLNSRKFALKSNEKRLRPEISISGSCGAPGRLMPRASTKPEIADSIDSVIQSRKSPIPLRMSMMLNVIL